MQRIQNFCLRFTVFACLTLLSLTVSLKATAQCVVPNTANTCYGNDVLFSNTTGTHNTGFGEEVLYSNTTGTGNTASGVAALGSNTTGDSNTAYGQQALSSNTTGYANSASGYLALHSNTTGFYNTASGGWALSNNTTGYGNTASGYEALGSNSTGLSNTASGLGSLADNLTGSVNTATGHVSLFSNTTGDYNTASGGLALFNNATGDQNTAGGFRALYYNTAGNRNTAQGSHALYHATGNRNVALGYNAGYAITTGENNIMIGAAQTGSASDSGVIRIGTKNYQKRAFIGGIRGVTTGRADAVPVVIDSNGQLGTISSSRRVKENIQPMGSVSERLLALRPVTFRYKTNYEDGSRPTEFGLIAEEVAEVFPELVVYGEDGKPETVSYHVLSTLLLNEVQKERTVVRDQAATISALQSQVDELNARLSRLEGG